MLKIEPDNATRKFMEGIKINDAASYPVTHEYFKSKLYGMACDIAEFLPKIKK